MQFLIVEDNPTVRQMIKSIVETWGDELHVFCECEDGALALAAYQRQHPDVVLMDIAVGQMDGITATGQITALDPQAHVIIVTSYDEADLREAARQAGACGYVLKQNLLELRQMLQSCERT